MAYIDSIVQDIRRCKSAFISVSIEWISRDHNVLVHGLGQSVVHSGGYGLYVSYDNVNYGDE